MTRTNEIPRADVKRLIKILSAPDELAGMVKEFGGSGWLEFIDTLARHLKLVDYDTEGVYRGYTSQTPSFVDNYIHVRQEEYRHFLSLPAAAQQKQVLDLLLSITKTEGTWSSAVNEFYEPSVMGRLDGFSTRGSATGVMPSLDFLAPRRFLLDLLGQCEPGVWYSIAALIHWLKVNQPYFLIPEKVKPARWGNTPGRYDNFYEAPDRYSNGERIPEGAPDAFERVEGRYVERFFEHIPLTLKFVDLAYDPRPYHNKVFPMIGWLKAFRVTRAFQRLIHGKTSPARVTVLPNFEIILESEYYPSQTIAQVEMLAEKTDAPAGGPIVTFLLKRERVAAALIQDPNLDPQSLLETLSGTPLPPNIVTELDEWRGHAERFTLYEGFGLLESDTALEEAAAYTAEQIAPSLWLVRAPDRLGRVLEQAELAPLLLAHKPTTISTAPAEAQTIFPHEIPRLSEEPETRNPKPVSLRRVIEVTLHFPFDKIGAEALEDFRRTLAEARCPVQADLSNRTITFPSKYLPQLEEVIKQFETRYEVRVLDE